MQHSEDMLEGAHARSLYAWSVICLVEACKAWSGQMALMSPQHGPADDLAVLFDGPCCPVLRAFGPRCPSLQQTTDQAYTVCDQHAQQLLTGL